MTECIDRAAGQMRVPGAAHQPEVVRHIPSDRLQEISAEAHAWELVLALQAALAGDSHWRHEAQLLLTAIQRGSLPEPPA
jgi:hypothetical protein